MNAQFIARTAFGLTEYVSRRTGTVYRLIPEDGGLTVLFDQTTIWLEKLSEAFRLIELIDGAKVI